jgi:hypothetical protein
MCSDVLLRLCLLQNHSSLQQSPTSQGQRFKLSRFLCALLSLSLRASEQDTIKDDASMRSDYQQQ